MNRTRLLFAALLALTASSALAETVEVEVNGLVCAFCAQGIEKTLKQLPATEDVFVSLEHRLVAIALKEGQALDDTTVREAITDAGYTTVAITRTDTPLDALRAAIHNRAAGDE